MVYTTVFDAAHQGVAIWVAPAFGLIFVALGGMLVFAPTLMLKLMPSGLRGRARTVFSWCFLLFSVLWTVTVFATTARQYRTDVGALREGRYSVIEGQVTQFIPMPYTGHGQESFVVNGHRFAYSDYVLTTGFHHTSLHGGPIRSGLNVRVSYIGRLIVRLEIAR